MDKFSVTGMSCAACSAHVEKAVMEVPGVTSVAVSLLTNSMNVEGTAAPSDVIQAVITAGYGASLQGGERNNVTPGFDEEGLKDHETPKLRKRLISSVVILIPLMYVTYDVELAIAVLSGRQSCGNGIVSDASDYSGHGHQSKIFYQWLYKFAA